MTAWIYSGRPEHICAEGTLTEVVLCLKLHPKVPCEERRASLTQWSGSIESY